MLRRSVALAFVLCLVGAACSTSDDANEDGGDGSASGEPIVIGFPADLSTDWATTTPRWKRARSSPSTRSTKKGACWAARSN